MLWIFLAVVCITADRLTKIYISGNFKLGESVPVIKNIFHITYHLNDGAAFSILQGRRFLLIGGTLVILAAVVVYIILRRPENKVLLLSLTLVVSGAIGNLIDRISSGEVVDFLDFRLINFPVFNIADSLVVIGAVCLCIYTLKYSGEI